MMGKAETRIGFYVGWCFFQSVLTHWRWLIWLDGSKVNP